MVKQFSHFLGEGIEDFATGRRQINSRIDAGRLWDLHQALQKSNNNNNNRKQQMHQEQKHDVHKLQGSADISAKSDIVFWSIFCQLTITRVARSQRYFEE